jgi:hypothetical protein
MASVARVTALAKKDTRGPLLSVAMDFLLNVVGTITLVKGGNLGIMGEAIGTLCADIAASIFLLGRMQTSRRKNLSDDNRDSLSEPRMSLVVIPTLENFRRFLQYAAPICFTTLGKTVVYNGVAFSVGRLSSVALAVHCYYWTTSEPLSASHARSFLVDLGSVLRGACFSICSSQCADFETKLVKLSSMEVFVWASLLTRSSSFFAEEDWSVWALRTGYQLLLLRWLFRCIPSFIKMCY